jgi:hypothetical protein
MRIMTQQADHEQAALAQRFDEGWVLANINGAGSIFHIEKYDEDPRERFANDGEAWDFVVARALKGSAFHIAALRVVSATEQADIGNHVGRLTLMAALGEVPTTVIESKSNGNHSRDG